LKTSPVLFLNTWYPNREDPWLGLFIRKHARALAAFCPVISLYLKSAPVKKMEFEWEQEYQYLALKAYYPRLAVGIPLIGPIIRAFAYPFFGYQAWRILKQKAGIQSPTRIVLNVTGPLVWLSVFLKLRYQIPLYWLEHWNAFLPKDPRYSGILIRLQAYIVHWFCSGTATVSNLLASGLTKHGLGKNIRCIPNVVDEAFFLDEKSKLSTKAPVRLAHISNFAPFKQADRILEAVSRVFKDRQDFVFEFTGLECPAKDALKLRAIELGLYPGKIDFIPTLTENQIPEYFSELSGLVSYSTQESQGVVLLEAWASGLSVIANPNMGAWELGPEEAKIEANPIDLESLIQAIHQLLDQGNLKDRAGISRKMKEEVSAKAVGRKLLEWLQV